jgi:small conductance mechanosensitive channel
MFVLVELGFDLNTILVVLGSIGLAIALAVKDSITNVTSGFMILFLNYYNIGDLIETDKTMGYVNSFNLFNTTIKDLDNVLVNIPNSSMVSNALTNYYKEKNMKLAFNVNISNYEKSTNIEEVSAALKEALAENCSFVLDKNDIAINVADLSKEGTLLKIKFPIESKNYFPAKNMAHNIVRETIREKNVFLLDYYYKDKEDAKPENKQVHKTK